MSVRVLLLPTLLTLPSSDFTGASLGLLSPWQSQIFCCPFSSFSTFDSLQAENAGQG